MTKKRWKIHEIKDRGLGFADLIDTKENRRYQFDVTDRNIRELVVTLLNEQHEENEQLKKEKRLLARFIRKNHDVTIISRILNDE